MRECPEALCKIPSLERGGVVVEYAIVLAFVSLILIAGAVVVTNAVNAYWPVVANGL